MNFCSKKVNDLCGEANWNEYWYNYFRLWLYL